MAQLKQSTARVRTFFMWDAGMTVSVSLSKNGGAFGAAAGAVAEIANGWYKVSLSTADTDTLGDLTYHCTATAADPCAFVDEVVARTVEDAPTAVENADALLKRDWTSVTGEAARSALNALRLRRNKWSVATGTLTVTKEDDTAAAWTAAVTSDAAADPIIGSDPV